MTTKPTGGGVIDREKEQRRRHRQKAAAQRQIREARKSRERARARAGTEKDEDDRNLRFKFSDIWPDTSRLRLHAHKVCASLDIDPKLRAMFLQTVLEGIDAKEIEMVRDTTWAINSVRYADDFAKWCEAARWKQAPDQKSRARNADAKPTTLIAKLLRTANDPAVSPAEAAAFRAKAEELERAMRRPGQ